MLSLNAHTLTRQHQAFQSIYYRAGRSIPRAPAESPDAPAESLDKQADTPQAVASLTGTLYLSKSGWLLLSVPNAFVRGLFDALHEPGAQLPLNAAGNLEAHITVMRPEEIEQLGGADNINERGHQFAYQTGPVKTVRPSGQGEFSAVWFVEVTSRELEKLRKSYGLAPTPKNGEHEFHITFAYRKNRVLQHNDVSKTAAALCIRKTQITLVLPPSLRRYADARRETVPERTSESMSETTPVEDATRKETAEALQTLGQSAHAPETDLDLLDDAVDKDVNEEEEKKAEIHHHRRPPSWKNRDGKEVDVCPHCGQTLDAKDIYTDKKGWSFCRRCFRKGKGAIRIRTKQARFFFNQPRNLNAGNPGASHAKAEHLMRSLHEAEVPSVPLYLTLPALGGLVGYGLENAQPDDTFYKRKLRSTVHGLGGGLGAALGHYAASQTSDDTGLRLGGGLAGGVLAYLLARAALPSRSNTDA